jgi:hypothetical protein
MRRVTKLTDAVQLSIRIQEKDNHIAVLEHQMELIRDQLASGSGSPEHDDTAERLQLERKQRSLDIQVVEMSMKIIIC